VDVNDCRTAIESMEEEYLETACDFYRRVDEEALTLTTAITTESQLERTRRALRRAKETLAAATPSNGLSAPFAYNAGVQAPVIVYSHIKGSVTAILTGPAAEKRLAEALASQKTQTVTSGRPSG
jgi:hypothetical protein